MQLYLFVATAGGGGGTVVLRLLELLDIVDKHLFHVSQWSSTVTALYDKIQNFSSVSCLFVLGLYEKDAL